MSFWALSDGGNANNNATSFEQEGGTIEPIPNNTNVTAFLEEVKWDKFYQSEDQYINLRWRVMAPQAYNNRVIFQRLDVLGKDGRAKDPQKKSDNAKRMLAAIDANCGGGLSRLAVMPQDHDLQANLLNKAMNIKVMLWEMKNEQGETNKGNWISMVSPRAAVDEPVVNSKPVQQQVQQQSGGLGNDLADEIPF